MPFSRNRKRMIDIALEAPKELIQIQKLVKYGQYSVSIVTAKF